MRLYVPEVFIQNLPKGAIGTYPRPRAKDPTQGLALTGQGKLCH